jgi:hypothetical protein
VLPVQREEFAGELNARSDQRSILNGEAVASEHLAHGLDHFLFRHGALCLRLLL